MQPKLSWKKDFFTVWSGQALSILGSQLVQFALIWFLTVKTGSATVLATASLAGMLPGVVLGPFVGTLVDRWNRRKTMIVADSIVAAASIVLAVLFMLGVAENWHIFLVMFIRSLAGCFHSNAMSASTSLMVPNQHLTRIQGVNQMLNGGLNIVSAPLGALLLGAIPVEGILAIDVVTAATAVLPLFFIQIPQPERTHPSLTEMETKATIWQDFNAGIRYMIGWPGLLIASLGTVVINFTIIPAFSLLPLMVKNFFGGSAIQLGYVESAMGIGTIVGGALLGVWGGFPRKIVTAMVGLMGMGIGTLLLALAPSFSLVLAICGAFVVGLMSPITMGPFFAIIQSSVEPEMQARIFSLLGSIGGGMAPIGLMVAGPVADQAGIQTWFFLGGGLCVVMAVAAFFVPVIMNIENGRGSQAPVRSAELEPAFNK